MEDANAQSGSGQQESTPPRKRGRPKKAAKPTSGTEPEAQPKGKKPKKEDDVSQKLDAINQNIDNGINDSENLDTEKIPFDIGI